MINDDKKIVINCRKTSFTNYLMLITLIKVYFIAAKFIFDTPPDNLIQIACMNSGDLCKIVFLTGCCFNKIQICQV